MSLITSSSERMYLGQPSDLLHCSTQTVEPSFESSEWHMQQLLVQTREIPQDRENQNELPRQHLTLNHVPTLLRDIKSSQLNVNFGQKHTQSPTSTITPDSAHARNITRRHHHAIAKEPSRAPTQLATKHDPKFPRRSTTISATLAKTGRISQT